MERLIQTFKRRLKSIDLRFKRYLWNEINWNKRLIAITGALGVGKTTFLLQYVKENFKDTDDVLYTSLDNLYFAKNSLYDLADEFVKYGGQMLLLDEVHKYKNWSVEVKNIYDDFPELKIILTGSSAIDIYKGEGDLSRRMVKYKMNGLSFREFIELKYNIKFRPYTLEEILAEAPVITAEINEKIKPLKLFKEYLQFGYYPFFIEGTDDYYIRIEQTVNQILEADLPSIEKINFNTIYNLKKLLAVLSEVVPYKPNISKLSAQIGISREVVIKYLYWLQRADLLLLLTVDTYGISKLNKPDKIYLNNPNLIYALTESNVNQGTIRETFFLNQLSVKHRVNYTNVGDFIADGKWLFEIGGKNKTRKQIAGEKNAFVVADGIEYPDKNRIPLWLFGFLY